MPNVRRGAPIRPLRIRSLPLIMDTQPATRGPSHATVFVWMFAVSSLWHYTSSANEIYDFWFHFDPVGTPLFTLAIVSAFVAAVFPNDTRAILFFAAGQTVAIFMRMPFVADHLIMELGLNVAILAAFLLLVWKPKSSTTATAADMFTLYSPVGRWLLIVMYFFGTFHKINPGFLSVDSSCAIPFIEGLPLPSSIVALPLTQYAAIYGTLILETLAMVLLLSARTKYFGMLLGMSFHFIIGVSSFGTLAHFSAFALALHTLFLPSGFGQRLLADQRVPRILTSPDAFKVFTVLLVALQLSFAFHLFVTREGYLVNGLFAVIALTLMVAVAKHGRMRSSDARYRLRSPSWALNLVPIWFFLHCMSPYIGLGTGGALAMFSGLRTEGGISNHFVFRKPIPVFDYQEKIVYIDSATNPSLQAAAADGQGVILFDFQRHFSGQEQLALPVTLQVDGTRYTISDLESMQEFANAHFAEQSWLERKYMSFRLVDDPKPNRCRH